MFSLNLTSRVLKEAQSHGLVGEERREDDGPLATEGGREADYWGAELASLVASGRLSGAMVNTLAWEAIGGEAGSWADPLFKGPAPIGELKGLGDRYQDLTPVGEGASAYVYKGFDTLLQRHVAIKALKDPRGPILEEARAQAKVEHPNVCRVYEVGQGYLVMQLVEGPTLAQMAPSIDLAEKARIIRDIAQGIHVAHQKGLIHLDLKLNNVLMERHEDGIFHPVISDFGMVSGASPRPSSGCNLGTPPYTSPEQLARDPALIGPGADVYALGVMLYVLLAGAIPFEAHDFPGLLEAMAKAPPIPLRRRVPQVAPDLARIVAKCMEKRPQDRYASARDLADDLDRFLRGEAVGAMGKAGTYRLAKWFQRNRKLQWVIGLSLALLVGSLAFFVRHSTFISQQAEWDHHFQNLVDQLGAHLDRSYRLPAHDLRPALREAAVFIEKLEDARRRGGPAAQGPACLALGQAHFLLEDDEDQAVMYFQKAWDMGYQTESARSWLAVAMLATYRKATWSFVPGLHDSANPDRAEEVRRQYLDPARTLLKGRGSLDQARLRFLVDLADAKILDGSNPDRLLGLIQAYRAQFPNDLEGMFEEAAALSFKAELLVTTASLKSPTYSPPGLQEAESCRKRVRELLGEVKRIAPSLPKVYGALATEYMRENSLPTRETEPTRELLAQTRVLLDEGLQIRPDDPTLILQYSQFLTKHVLSLHLASGLDPAPVARDLQGLRTLSASNLDGQGPRAFLEAAAVFLRKCSYYGVRPPQSMVDACAGCAKEAWTGNASERFMACAAAAQALAETGANPVPCIQDIHEVFHPATVPEWYALANLDLLAAEHVWLDHGDPSPWIARAQAALPKMDSYDIYKSGLAKSIRIKKAQLLEDEASWADLRQDLVALGKAGAGMPPRNLPDALELSFLLARHAQTSKAEAQPYLDGAQACLREPVLKDYVWTPGYQEQLATLCLLGAGRAEDPDALLAQALAAADKALEQLLPPRITGDARTLRPRPDNYPDYPAALARIRPLKAEILTAMAARERQPSVRIDLARRALAALEQTLKQDPFRERRLRPLLDQARTLSRS
ncbi:MAG: serine/threonine protein kinase [Geothrix sp.]|uniref:serine/threonine-protein kinase n=1 Tax=Geothrix sp. TaxID=1962974 RepID=UPI0018253AE6|nr:serine/threonine-protein kinase [Geothrix sp.]NWJ42496.1 serine/threonine protein kinase [Geothrix sp.]WIL19542.1 MAG: serine/threonine protein kinase [Geothrix sp.]